MAATKTRKKATTKKTTKSAKASKAKSKRPKILERSVTSVLRWCGANGFTKEQAASVLKAHKIAGISETTIGLQINAGKRGADCYGPIPSLTRAEAKKLKDAAKA